MQFKRSTGWTFGDTALGGIVGLGFAQIDHTFTAILGPVDFLDGRDGLLRNLNHGSFHTNKTPQSFALVLLGARIFQKATAKIHIQLLGLLGARFFSCRLNFVGRHYSHVYRRSTTRRKRDGEVGLESKCNGDRFLVRVSVLVASLSHFAPMWFGDVPSGILEYVSKPISFLINLFLSFLRLEKFILANNGIFGQNIHENYLLISKIEHCWPIFQYEISLERNAAQIQNLWLNVYTQNFWNYIFD